MSTAPPRWRHVANGAALVALLSVASLVLHSTPDRDLQQSPIVVPATLGEPASGRNIRATVHSVAVTEAVSAENGWAGTTAGVWVVVEVSVEAVLDDQGAALGTAILRVGDTDFSASTRPDEATVASVGLATGVPLTGPIVFEVPVGVVSSAAAGSATLLLATNTDPRLDSLLEVPVDLSALDVQQNIDLEMPQWGAR